GQVPIFITNQDTVIDGKEGVVLVAPIFAAGGEVRLLSKEGTVCVKPATFRHDMDEEVFSASLSFLFSTGVEAAIRKDCGSVSKALLRSFPLLASMDDLCHAQ